MKARNLLTVSIAALAMGLVLTGCEVKTQTTTDTGTSTQKMTPVQVSTAKADRRDIVGYRILMGSMYIPAAAQADVMATASLAVQTVHVTKGEHVAKGETLIDLATGQDANYQQAKTTYEAAQTAYQSALAQYEQPVRDAQRAVDQARSSERTIRQSTLPGGDATALQQAVAARHQAEDNLKLAQAQAKTNELPYKTQLDQAKTALDQARSGMKESKISAPISGTVVTINAQPGQTLNAQTPVAKIVDLDALAVKARVSPEDAPFVKEHTPVVVTFNDFPDRTFKGRVRTVQALPAGNDGKVQYEATIDFTNVERMVTPDATVHTVGVEVGHRRDVVAVPVDSVTKDPSGKPVVKVLDNGNWKPVVVELGMTDGNFVEVRSGVKDGDSVQVVTGQGQWLFGTNLTGR